MIIGGERALAGDFKLGGPVMMIFFFTVKELDDAKRWMTYIQKQFDIDEAKMKIKVKD